MRRLGLTVVRAGASSFLGTRDREGTSDPSCVALRGKVGGPCRCTILPVPAYELSPIRGRQRPVQGCQGRGRLAGLTIEAVGV
jgi:hypothetical protein